jgi:hypothetical protein
MVAIFCMMYLLAQVFHLLLQPLSLHCTLLQLSLCIMSTKSLVALLRLPL